MFAAAVSAALVGCSSEQGPARAQAASTSTAQPSRQTFALGSQLAPGGAVAEDATSETFSRGGEVFLSVDVTGASIDQEIAVEWLDAAGNVVGKDQRHVNEGAHYVTFSSRPPRQGGYKAVVVINGRRVTELPFAVI